MTCSCLSCIRGQIGGVGACFLTRELYAGIVARGCGGCDYLFSCLHKLFVPLNIELGRDKEVPAPCGDRFIGESLPSGRRELVLGESKLNVVVRTSFGIERSHDEKIALTSSKYQR